MALVKCRECAAEVSGKAKSCPHCGVSNPGRSKFGVVTAFVGFFVALMLISNLGTGKGNVGPTVQANFTRIPDPPVSYMPLDGHISDSDRWGQERIIRYTALQHIAARYGNCKFIPDSDVSEITIKSSQFENKEENIEIFRKYGMSDRDVNEASDRILNFDRENHEDFDQCSSINRSYVEAISNFISSGADPYALDQYFSG